MFILLYLYYQNNIGDIMDIPQIGGDNMKSSFEIFYGHKKSLDDVIGNEEAKDEIEKILDMIKHPKKYTKYSHFKEMLKIIDN